MTGQPIPTPPGVTDAATLAETVRLTLDDYVPSPLLDHRHALEALAELEVLAARTQHAEQERDEALGAAECAVECERASLARAERAEEERDQCADEYAKVHNLDRGDWLVYKHEYDSWKAAEARVAQLEDELRYYTGRGP